ncbi:MAG: glycine zipper 2TM domain-containing protein [Bauldia sp.]|nr:glycine zipper 2TM domain-containing protein [Bauldia sp.]
MIVRSFVVLCAAGTMLAGCVGMGPGQQIGTLGGAVAGGAIGSAVSGGSTAGTIAGAVIGGFLGGEIGRGLDEQSRQRAAYAQYQALEYGTQQSWQSPNGPYGYTTPGPAYQVNAYSCRDFTQTIYIDGIPQTARGTACRNPDGTWTPVT